MIVCHQYKYIFIKTRRTAGTSLEIALSQFCGPTDILSALSDEDENLRKELGYRGSQFFFAPLSSYTLQDWRRFVVNGKRKLTGGQHSPASFVKNLVDNKVWETYYKFAFERNPFDRAISRYYWKTKEFRTLPDINEYIQENDRKQLSNWSKYTIDDHIIVDHVGRYETLSDDVAKIKKTIGIPDFNMPHIKSYARRDRRHYSQLLNAKTRAHIEKVCENEIRVFQYQW